MSDVFVAPMRVDNVDRSICEMVGRRMELIANQFVNHELENCDM